MRIGLKGTWRNRFNISLVLTILLSAQVVHAQMGEDGSRITEPLNLYILHCIPKDDHYAEIFYSASPKDIFEIDRHLENTYFRVHEFINTADDGQFLKGYFYDGNRSTRPMGLPIPEDRIDKYRREDGFREIWFVRSNQWLCFYDIETQEWLRQVHEEGIK